MNFPFAIDGWDAEKLDLFNQDVSGVDVELVTAWVQLFIMKGETEKVEVLFKLLKSESRFRDYTSAKRLLSPFRFIEQWNVSI